MHIRALFFLTLFSLPLCAAELNPEADLSAFYSPPAEFKGDVGKYKLPLPDPNLRPDVGRQWKLRRSIILAQWHRIMGPWPELLSNPKIEFLDKTNRENFVQHRIRVQTARGQTIAGYLLIPSAGRKPMPAVIVPFYEAETSIGLGKPMLDFGYQLAKRGFVTLSIGSPGGDAWKPDKGAAQCQPLSFLAYIAANCHTALSRLKEVDP